MGEVLACPHLAGAPREPFTDLQGYNSWSRYLHGQPLVPKHNAVPGWLGPKRPQSRLGWSCPGPGTMDACSLPICLTQCGLLPNKDHLAVSLLSASAYSQKSKATLSGKGGAAPEVQRVLGRVEKEGSNPACVQPWSSGTPLCGHACPLPPPKQGIQPGADHRSGCILERVPFI